MLVGAIILITLGILIKYGKMHFLIAGYNTLPKKEKAKYDIEGIASVMRNALFGMALFIIIGYCISKYTNNPLVASAIVTIGTIVFVLYAIIEANSKKYKIK